MRIEYMMLENFAMVKSGMGLDKLELDFHGFKNVITLIVGNNGTGKTGAVLSNLHPYAGLGHLEARDDSDIIIPGKDGHKIIIFKTKKHEYYIEHFYQYQGKKRSRKISSYCKKDGKELNPSGSVNAFNTLIECEFQIDMNFLKLMRLGPNVKNFISLGATERKSFIAKLLAEVESYIKDQKSASERSSLLNNELKIALDKKKRLDIDDITTLYEDIKKKKELIEQYRILKESKIKDFYTYKGKIDTTSFDSYDEDMKKVTDELHDLQKEYNSLDKPKVFHIMMDNALELFNQDIKSYQDERMKIVSKIASYNTKIDSYREKYNNLTIELSQIQDTIEKKELHEYISSLKKKISEYEKNYDLNDIPSVSKNELQSDVDKINMILFHINEILELPDYTLKYFKSNFDKYGMDIAKLDIFSKRRNEEVIVSLQNLGKKKLYPDDMMYVLFTPEGCTEYKKCPYYKIIHTKQYQKNNKERRAELEEEQECLEGLSIIASSLYSISKIVSMMNPDIKEYSIKMENVYQAILEQDKRKIISLELIQSLTDKVESYEEYLSNKKNLDEAQMKYKVIEASNPRDKSDILDEQAKITLQINELEDSVRKYDNELEKLNLKINATEENVHDYTVQLQYNLNSSKLEQKIHDCTEKIQKLSEIAKDKEIYEQKKMNYLTEIDNISKSIKNEEDELYRLRNKETTYKQLTKEIEDTEKYYSYAELIKDAVSSKTGIPKVHIMFYCRALKNVANKIISEIYDGDLVLRDFEITDTKFNIPYYTKGVNVSDIRYGSQAETSVATVAISFAILIQFMPKYNIMLLDEIDGPLYETNKEKLFASIEGEVKSIGCEQVFMITQSKSYLNYPVNLIITDKDYSVQVTNKQSIIFQR